MAQVFEVMRGGGDNLSYVIGCSTERVAAVVDPTSPHALLEFCESRRLQIIHVLNTHGHPDHIGGNDVIAAASGAGVLAHPLERVDGASELKDGMVIEIGKVKVTARHCPGHTLGSFCFKVGLRLITGDTVFVAGAGNTRFGGDVEDLYRTFENIIFPLTDRTQLFPGHDYAEACLRFAQSVEPDNPHIERKLKEVRKAQRKNALVKTTIGQERLYNPFFRYRVPELIQSLQSEYPELPGDDPAAVFRLLRELRNNW